MQIKFTSGGTLQIPKSIAESIKDELAKGRNDWHIFEDNVNPGVGTFLMLNLRNVDCIVDKETLNRMALKKMLPTNGKKTE